MNSERQSRSWRAPPAVRIFSALVAGLVAGGWLARARFTGLDRLLAMAGPVGRLWLDALTMTVVPLVFALLVTGIAGAAATAGSGTVARRAMLWFAALLIASCAVSAGLAQLLLTAWPVDVLSGSLPGAAPPVPEPGSTWLSGIIPANPIKAAADTAMVPLVVFALLFGFATARIAQPLADSLLTFFRAIVEAMLVIVHWVLWLAPVGVFALAFGVGARLGLGAAGTLLQYVVVVVSCCLVTTVLVSVTAMIAGRLSPMRFLRAAFQPQVVAVSTQSSLASLPAMIDAAPALGVD
ncbi:MAG: cation:dicarboxylase symporter family transporter, partial [Novosphingobium sp.]